MSSVRGVKAGHVVLIAVAASVTLSACSGGGGTGSAGSSAAEPALPPIGEVTRTQQVVRPIDAYLPSTEEVQKVVAVNTEVMNRCLTSHGLSGGYAPADDPSQVPIFIAELASDNSVRNDLWGFFDTNTAGYSRFGYKRPPSESGDIVVTMPKGPHDVVKACDAGANSPLPGGSASMPEFLVDIHSLPQRGPQVPLSDSRWLAAQKRWSKCMEAAGFAGYTTPLDAMFDKKWEPEYDKRGSLGGGGASSEEVATATADIVCKQKTNLVGVGLAVQSAYDQQYIATNRQALGEYRTKITSYLAQK